MVLQLKHKLGGLAPFLTFTTQLKLNVMTKEQMINTLKSQLPGFYSVEQVIGMINQIEEPSGFSQDKLDNFIDDIVVEIKDGGLDIINDYELEMNYREVELISIEVDRNSISRVVKDSFKNNLID